MRPSRGGEKPGTPTRQRGVGVRCRGDDIGCRQRDGRADENDRPRRLHATPAVANFNGAPAPSAAGRRLPPFWGVAEGLGCGRTADAMTSQKEDSTMSTRKVGLVLVLIVSAAVCCATVAVAQQIVTDGLVGYWTLDADTIDGNVVQDLSGNDYHGTAVGGPEPTDGKINGALLFDGDNDFVRLPDMGGASQVTIEVWAWAEGLGAMNGLVSDTQWANGTVHFKLRDSKFSLRNPSQGAEQLGPSIGADEWVHLAYTADPDEGELNGYVDGELEVESDYNDSSPVRLNELKIGDEYQGEDRFFEGILDEVRIYDRILTDEEIERNYRAKSNSLAVRPAGKLSVRWGEIKALP